MEALTERTNLTGRTKLVVALVVLLLLGIFLPPNINGTRFRDRLKPALSAALGREVKIGQVKYRLLPRPGFDLYDFQVMDDPAFSAEPLLMCGKVTADLRLTSLWKGRLEIANLKLTDDALPPSLNLVHANGHWNVESLLLRVEQVPSAPTAKRRSEQRARFPYIAATGGRINLKFGPEKTPFTLTNTDFAFWLASEDLWHVRLEGRPVRADMNLSDTGTVKLDGDLHRSRELQDMPVRLHLNWEKAQLGQFSSLLTGRDRGWRGGLSGDAQLSGTLANLHITGATELSHFRRYDINRDSMPVVRTRCLGDYARSALELKCDTPLESGGLLLTARWLASTPRDYDLSMVATRVPLSLVATLARHARSTLPDDLTATGDFNGALGFHSRNGVRNWHGAGMTSPFVLQSSVAEKPFPVSSIKFRIGLDEVPASLAAKRAKLATPQNPAPQPDALTIDSFSIQMGPSTALEVQGSVDAAGYHGLAKGLVPLERFLVLAKTTGFDPPQANFNASAVVDFNVGGAWANFAPPHVGGKARVQNLTAWIPGVKDRLVLSEADIQLTDAALVLNDISGQFEHSPILFTGKITSPYTCPSPPCLLEFDLHADTLAMGDAASLLGPTGKGWNLPFLSGSPDELPDFRARGTFSAGQLIVARLPLEKFTSHIEVSDRELLVTHISAKLGGGAVDGEWRVNWSGSPSRYTATGSLTGVAVERLAPAPPAPNVELLNAWITGKLDGKYSFHFEGKNEAEMLLSAAGRADFTIANGNSHTLSLEPPKPFRFQSLQGTLELDKQTLRVLPSKFRADNRIYELSGTVTLADKQAKLRVSNGGARWDFTGDLSKPQLSAQHLTAQTTPTHRQ